MAEKLKRERGGNAVHRHGRGWAKGKVVGNRCSAPISKTTLRRTALNRFTEQRTAEEGRRRPDRFSETPSSRSSRDSS